MENNLIHIVAVLKKTENIERQTDKQLEDQRYRDLSLLIALNNDIKWFTKIYKKIHKITPLTLSFLILQALFT